jgi:hypothetical protein
MAKQVTFPSNPRNKPAPEDLDAFVHGGGPTQPEMPAQEARRPEAPLPKAPMKRLTFDVPADLHMRMKLACVKEGRDMAEVIRELLSSRFP